MTSASSAALVGKRGYTVASETRPPDAIVQAVDPTKAPGRID
jgi:hypothetical protein